MVKKSGCLVSAVKPQLTHSLISLWLIQGNSVQQLVNQWRSRVQELITMSGNTRASMVRNDLNDTPTTH